LAGKLYPLVILVFPVGQPFNVTHSSNKAFPAALCIAPSIPPPPKHLSFAAFTIASISRRHISPRQ